MKKTFLRTALAERRRRICTARVATACVLAAMALTAFVPQAAEAGKPGTGGTTTASYAAEAVGILPGNNQSFALGISLNGNVVGMSAGGSNVQRAFYWDARTRTLSDLTSVGASGRAHAIAGGATEYAVGYEKAADGGHAVIWVAPPSAATYLDGPGSTANGVNDGGVAVGGYRGKAAIWSLSGGKYVRTDIPLRTGDDSAFAEDINNDGIVIGYVYLQGTYAMRAFVWIGVDRMVNLPPLPGDPESSASAISNIVPGGTDPVVYISGSSGVLTSGLEKARAMRWTVNTRTGEIVQTQVLTQTGASGVNDAGDVAGTTTTRSTQAASLWRNGTYIPLKAPKGGTSSAAYGMMRTVGSPTYVAGVSMVNNWPMAVRWVIR